MASSLISLGVCFFVCFMAAASGALFRPGDWYRSLAKPAWTPPNGLFPVVWGILFTLMAISAWLVWQEQGSGAAIPLTLFAGHLVINAAWSYLFFGLRRMDWAMGDVILLWIMIAFLIFLFGQISLISGLLLVPYLLWVTVASALNFSLLRLNGRDRPKSLEVTD